MAQFKPLYPCCIIFVNCTNKPKADTSKEIISSEDIIILDVETQGYKILIEEIENPKKSIITNSHSLTPYLGVKADYISLRDLMGLIKNIDPSSIELANRSLDNKHYSVLISQNWVDENREEKIKNAIIEALGISIETQQTYFDTTVVALSERSKFLKFSSEQPEKTIKNKFTLSRDFISFENTDLDNLVASLDSHFNKVLTLNSKETQRINYKIKRADWNTTKIRLETGLGLSFSAKNNPIAIEKLIISN
ncbi:hypothetical protein [Echinicola shivajiensis]|uniref:hypothetical protein n=1 Tax=Echinicola shivajiensis TaxID=1035916 RepID=UPI001BFC8034|nr:hypothetical protein [Echinicola shivajiensis]